MPDPNDRGRAQGQPDNPGAQNDPGPNPQDQNDGRRKRPNPLKNPRVLLIGAIVLAALLIAALIWWLNARQYVSTDDAFVDTHIVRLAPQVSGSVSRVLVDDNAPVRAGQVLVEIDPSTLRTALNQAEAQRAEATAKVGQARAQLESSQAAYRQAADQAKGLAAQAAAAARDAARLQGLLRTSPRAVSRQQVDQATAQARQAAAQRDAALQQAASAQAQVRAAATNIAAGLAQQRAAEASIAQNQLTLGHAQVIAPIDGYVAQMSVAPGAYVEPGQQLMAIVPNRLWVTANFKETQLALMRPGQPVDLSIDACPAKLHGHVLSIQRGAGQAFALLPPENATGNYVKVVQRVPVKIAFDDVPKNCPLGPGLSVAPRVKVR